MYKKFYKLTVQSCLQNNRAQTEKKINKREPSSTEMLNFIVTWFVFYTGLNVTGSKKLFLLPIL